MYKHYFNEISGLSAVFTDRHDGKSQAAYSSLNLGLNTGDDRQVVKENRQLLFTNLGFDTDSVAYSGQIHSDTVAVVESPGINLNTDALITQKRNLPLVIQAADCACIFLADPKQQVIAAVHSGWRGTALQIVKKTIAKMSEQFAVNPVDLRAVISPCISASVFEVGADVYSQFDPMYFTKKNDQKWLLNLKSVLHDQLYESGVRSIYTDTDCTYLNRDNYFSYRRDGAKSGRMMGIIWLG
ncbi:MAG: peptidoglycan editing factor PgeF [Calditrichaeota bacterium]|nr:peptidoglycan editing factor PgeF [Calditrichota bacterium]